MPNSLPGRHLSKTRPFRWIELAFFDTQLLRDWMADILERAQVPREDAILTADFLLRSDARGVGTHGISRLPAYVQKLHSGEVNSRPNISIHGASGLLTIEADGALGQVAAARALKHGLARLALVPMVLCQLRECGHLGALGLYALAAAEAGAIAVVAQRTPPLVSMPGLAGPVIGNNPLAFACPIAGRAPLVVDMASSVAARGHILLRARTGEPIPEGWAVDGNGVPTTDASAALEGALMPSGGHKGLALAMLVELLAGAMTATPASIHAVQSQPKVATLGAVGRQSACILLFNQQALGADHAAQGADLAAQYLRAWSDDYLERGGSKARLPGVRGDQLEKQTRVSGIQIAGSLLAELQQLAVGSGIALPEALAEAA